MARIAASSSRSPAVNSIERPLQLQGGERGTDDAVQLGVQALLPEPALGAEGLGDAVGDDDELLPLSHVHVLDCPARLLEGSQHRRRDDRLDHRVAIDQQRRRVTGDRETDRLRGVFVDRQRGDAAKRGSRPRQQFAVERFQGDYGIAGEGAGGAQRVAGVGGHGRRLGTAAGDVADHHHPAPGDAEGVVEVAADLVLGAGRAVHRGDGPAGDVRQRRRQQAALQGRGDLRPFALAALEIGEQAGVVERQRHTTGEDAGEVGVVRAEAPAGVANADGQHPRRPPAGSQLDGDRRAHAEGEQELQILLVVGDIAQVGLGNPFEEMRLLPGRRGGVSQALLERRRAFGEPPLNRLRPRAVDPHRGAANPLSLEHVDRAEVAELRHEDVGDRLERLLQRAVAVGDVSDVAEDLETAPGLIRSGAKHGREGSQRRKGDHSDCYRDPVHRPFPHPIWLLKRA